MLFPCQKLRYLSSKLGLYPNCYCRNNRLVAKRVRFNLPEKRIQGVSGRITVIFKKQQIVERDIRLRILAVIMQRMI